MQQKYFIEPFAAGGDLTPAIPNAPDPTGAVSYTIGFGFDYQRDILTDPAALSPLRTQFNILYNDVTVNLQNYQQFGSPEFIDSSDNGGSAFSYGIGAQIRYSSSGTAPFGLFYSLVDGNTNIPLTDTSWWCFEWINIVYSATHGGGDAYTITLSPIPGSYNALLYMPITIGIATTNTTTVPTLNINGLGAKPITNSDGSAIRIGQLAWVVTVKYNGTDFLIQSATVATKGALLNVVLISGPTSGTYNPSSSAVNSIIVKGQAPGGGSGGVGPTGVASTCVSGGAGGGGYFEHRVTSGLSGISYNIGSPGVGGAATPTNGTDGGDTIFGGIVAHGGAGSDGIAASTSNSAAGAGPPGSTNNAANLINRTGGPGVGGISLGVNNGFGGSGGSAGDGGGGAPAPSLGNGTNASSPGSGASGATNCAFSSGGFTGGTGGNGYLIIEEYS